MAIYSVFTCIYPLKIVIFHSYVKLPEGISCWTLPFWEAPWSFFRCVLHHFRHLGRSLEVLRPRTLSQTCSPEEFRTGPAGWSPWRFSRYAMGAKPIFAMNIARSSEKKGPKCIKMPGDFFGCTMMDLYQLVYWRWPWSNMRIIDQPVEKMDHPWFSMAMLESTNQYIRMIIVKN